MLRALHSAGARLGCCGEVGRMQGTESEGVWKVSEFRVELRVQASGPKSMQRSSFHLASPATAVLHSKVRRLLFHRGIGIKQPVWAAAALAILVPCLLVLALKGGVRGHCSRTCSSKKLRCLRVGFLSACLKGHGFSRPVSPGCHTARSSTPEKDFIQGRAPTMPLIQELVSRWNSSYRLCHDEIGR